MTTSDGMISVNELVQDILTPSLDTAHAYAWATDIGDAIPDIRLVSSFDGDPGALPPDALRLRVGVPCGSAPRLLAFATPLLSAEEVLRANQFRVEADACAYLAARVRLRLSLAGLAKCHPADLQLLTHPGGKPFLAGIAGRIGAPPLHFNLSHTRTRIMIGISWRPVGVDVEAVVDMPDLMATARLAFAPRCLSALEALQGEARVRLFYRFWTLGEAFIKATGAGISQGLDTFAFSASGKPVLRQVTPGWGSTERWRFGQLNG